MTKISAPPVRLEAPADRSHTWIRHVERATERDVARLRGCITSFCRAVLEAHGLRTDEIALFAVGLVASELITNVVRHAERATKPAGVAGRPFMELYVQVLPQDEILISVFDRCGQGPRLNLAALAQEESGRGLGIVHSITNDRWGWHPVGNGKNVWAICPKVSAAPACAT